MTPGLKAVRAPQSASKLWRIAGPDEAVNPFPTAFA